MTQPTRSKAEETRARILEGALKLFREKGFDATTMRDIAQAAGMSLGSTYYHFDSKEALVMAFYQESQDTLQDLIPEAMTKHKDLASRVRVVLQLRFEQFGPNRAVLGALFRNAADPQHSLSPFSAHTKAIRDRAIAHFEEAVRGGDVKVPKDLQPHLPRLLWMYQMGLILFWIYDRSKGQARTLKLLDKSLPVLVSALKLSKLPLMGPVRAAAIDLLSTVLEPEPAR
ncbi:MAG TPA: TetR family transcriptional regulator [Holophagaceae bacterium]|jgi:AcrR family transcriptional regulator|nr:TetR family transcriptional regulator [Holophagaceae bacterium]